ncbi:MAG TPA: membrane dipeptidase [Bryobacteraceae bacterium]|nr:membrane dipeptidase [Bryobacteraceae bacterium]
MAASFMGAIGAMVPFLLAALLSPPGVFTFDAHVHVINRQFYHGGNIGDRLPDGQFDLPRARKGGVNALFFSLFVTEEYYPQHYETKQALRLVDLALRQLEENRDTIELARNGRDIDRIVASGKIAAVLDMEGSLDRDGDLGVLRRFYQMGLRSYQLSAHNAQNGYADSCCSPPQWHGLNARGRALVAEMNRLGMVINVSHASDEAISQAIDVSTDPVIATHHGLREFNDIPRNMPDWLLKKLAAKGGLIGFQIGNEFHNRRVFDWRTQHAGKPFWDTARVNSSNLSIEQIDKIVAPQFPMLGSQAPDNLKFTVDQWLQVTDRAIQLVGEDHVILGTDFDGGPTLPLPMRDISDTPLVIEAMRRRGYSEERIRKIMGGNLLRVFRQITDK